MSPGVSIGTSQGGGLAFPVTYWYVPTPAEWLIVLGILAFGALAFTVVAAILPMQEHEALQPVNATER